MRKLKREFDLYQHRKDSEISLGGGSLTGAAFQKGLRHIARSNIVMFRICSILSVLYIALSGFLLIYVGDHSSLIYAFATLMVMATLFYMHMLWTERNAVQLILILMEEGMEEKVWERVTTVLLDKVHKNNFFR